MQFQTPLDAIRHASAQATTTGKPWAVYDCDGEALTVAPAGSLPGRTLEVFRPLKQEDPAARQRPSSPKARKIHAPLSAYCYFKADCKYVFGIDEHGAEHLIEQYPSLMALMAASPSLISTHRAYVTARPIFAVEMDADGCLMAIGENFKIPVSRRRAPAVRARIRRAAANA